MPHAPGEDVRPKRKRKPAPKPRNTATQYRFNNPTHDTPPAEPAPTYGPGRISPPTSTLDRILAAGAGPLNIPEGKVNIPTRSHATPRLALPVIEPPAAGSHNATRTYQSLFGRGGRTVVPPATQAMLEHATGNKHKHDAAQYLLNAQSSEDLRRRTVELGLDPTSDLNNLVHAIESTFGAPTHNIAGFPQTGRTALPSWQRDYLLENGRAIEQQTGKNLHLPDNPTDQDIVRYAYGIAGHSGSYWDVLKNLPKDAVETPLYAFQGGYATGHAANRLLHGDTGPAREIVAQQIDTLRHPGAFVQEHPFQSLLAGGAVASRAGALTARARGAALEPREVPTRYGSTIDRGVSPPNDYVRAIQGAQDFLTRPHEGAGRFLNPIANRLQDSGLRKNLRQIDRQHRSQQGLDTQALEQRVEDAKNKLSRAQQERVLSHEAMGFTPEELAGFRGTEPTTREPLSPAEETYRQALEDYRRASETAMMDAGMLGSGARLHREADPLAQVLADQGNPLATRYLEVNDELSTLQQQLQRTPQGDPKVKALQERLSRLQNRRASAAQRLLDSLETQIATHRRSGRSSDLVTEPPATQLTGEIERQIARERRVAEQSHQSQIRSLERELARMKRLRAKTSPGKRPLRKGTPGQIRALTTRLDHLREHPPIDEATGAYTSPRVRTLEQRLASSRERSLGSASRDAEAMRRLEERRSNLLRSQVPVGEITSPEIQRLQQQLEETPTRGMIEGQIGQAFTDRNDLLNHIVEQRTAAGMPAPFRVPLNEANTRQGLFTRSGSGPGDVKKRGKRIYTGGRFRSGEYEAPTHDQIMRDIRAPLNAQTYHRLANHVLDPQNGIARPATPGEPIPEDMVLVNPAQPADANVPLETVRPGESIFKRLDFHASEVPAGEGYALVPRVVAEEIHGRGEQLGKGRPGGKISQGLRNVLLYSRPSYALTNLVGNIQQGLLEGTGPLSYARAGRNNLPIPAGVEEGGAVRVNFSAYGEALADKVTGQNPVRAAATVLGHPIAAYTQSMRHLAQQVEDFTRRATYLKNAIPAARNIAHADEPAFQRFAASFRGVDEATRRVLEQMARGEGAPGGAVELAAKDAMQTVDRVLGDYASLPSNAVVDIAFPFHRWAQFASRLLAVTLPVHYPGRALILYRLGALGQEAQNQIGPLTPSLQGIIPVGNDPQDILALNTAYPNTFATLGEALAPDPRGGSEIAGLNPKGAASYLSPIARLAQALITGVDPTTGFTYTNARGEGIISSDRDHPPDPNATEDFLRLVAGQTLSMIPPLRLAFSPTNTADTSIPLPGLQQTRYVPPTRPGFLPPKPSAQLDLTPEQRVFNFFSPFRVRRINLEDLAAQGVQQTKDRLRATQRKESR